MWGNLRGRGKAYRKIWCKGSEEGAEEGTHPGRYHKAESVEEGERTQETGKAELHNRRQLDHTHLSERQEGKLGRDDKAYAEIHKTASDQIPEIRLDLKVYLETTDRKEGCDPHPYPLKCRIKYRDPDRKDCRELWTHGNPNMKVVYDLKNGDLAEYIATPLQEWEPEKAKAYHPSRNLIRKEPSRKEIKRRSLIDKDGVVREPKAPKGYYVDPDSIKKGINPVTGYAYRHYTLVKIDRRI